MRINFIGTGIKREVDDIVFLICENITNRITNINNEIEIEYNYRTLSEELYRDMDDEDEVLFAKSNININNLNISIDLKKLTYKEDKVNIFINIIYQNAVDGDEENITEEQQNFMYQIKVAVSKAVSKYMNSINWIYDEQNGYMSQKLYLKVYELENKFRGLINEYMLKQFGEDWFASKISSEFNSKSQEYGEWYNTKYKTLNYIKSELFNLQTRDLINMLKVSYENEELSKVDSQVNAIKNILRNEADKIVTNEILNEKTLWEQYFKDVLDENIETIWTEFSNMRNIIAHNKVISIEFFNDMINNIAELNTIIERSRESINIRIKSQEEKLVKQHIEEEYSDLILSEVDFSSYDNDEEVIDRIFNDGELSHLYCTVEDKAKELEESYKELRDSLDEINFYYDEEDDLLEFKERLLVVNNAINDQDKIIVSELINTTDKLEIIEEISCYLSNMTEVKNNKINECIKSILWSTEFSDNEKIFSYCTLNGDVFSVDIKGWFCVGIEELDDIFIDYTKNSEIIKRGGIDISFGDYEQHEDGYYMPNKGQYFNINVEQLYNKIEDDVDEITSSINSICEEISKII
ncbi:hypothetical protein [Clostridium butyricum]|uniref:Swt1-like HEPN domain-containing protein n=1 Tax=Clostridium butyricum E4 str. BoNT E BL5262 TaxID=632245 RepID=C4IG79_CLOBU|nr:hypothetical protein [Clostridium butyricum]EDT73605.1 hypothetical protein CBY_1408 [Clostridium butyricum 5521]EEP53598.1 hypothetical protein CLP_2091 [Clostridium butyricum E4 str. BoNT E BL5262]NFL31928.1 hypothetical protein [Clostridium butyricum]NFS19385.1 hypothetical protein [Clostridium butyricum]